MIKRDTNSLVRIFLVKKKIGFLIIQNLIELVIVRLFISCSVFHIEVLQKKKLKNPIQFIVIHYEDVSRQDPLLKPNHANVMEVPGSCKIRVVPKAAPSCARPQGQKTQKSLIARSISISLSDPPKMKVSFRLKEKDQERELSTKVDFRTTGDYLTEKLRLNSCKDGSHWQRLESDYANDERDVPFLGRSFFLLFSLLSHFF